MLKLPHHLNRAIIMGILGTILFEALVASAPMMGAPVLNVALWDGSLFTLNLRLATILGFGLELLLGTILAYIYQHWIGWRLQGPFWQKGLVFGISLWVLLMVFGLPLFDRISPLVNNGLMLAPGLFAKRFGLSTALTFLLALLAFGLSLSYFDDHAKSFPF
ncbi:hypothetical protein SAMN00768000_1578 [Sulfobacillus thermosulfidooxidans DSM 9293]|uniref:Uncharacterized protein n=1 Tax=Sulfobacillus thermosulfidooxidans (strain DSM 9293 / VKM B-1269 / AT-1) TaxID=929705 RepID=A0A1W1WDC0_SULTA|nr:hypothetical protein [Sulfobacillus thermosulfidooxidans]SMC04311.1 hypothetical protein SAMN00768000_1578 [Sulfobacillus thermosulfidooxidans DSM 9293]